MTDQPRNEPDLIEKPKKLMDEQSVVARVRAPVSRIGINTREGEVTLTDELKEEYLRLLSITGQIAKCAYAIGMNPSTLRRHRKDDEQFEEDVANALDAFRGMVDMELTRRAIYGYEEVTFIEGPEGETTKTVTKKSDPLLLALAKRWIPEYKERIDVTGNVKSQTVVIPSPISSIEEIEALAEKAALEQNRGS